MSEAIDKKLLDYYRDKVCVSYVVSDKKTYDITEVVEAFADYEKAHERQMQLREDGTYLSFANLKEFPEEAIEVWLDIHKDSLLPTTRSN
jgi:hypothetical protein